MPSQELSTSEKEIIFPKLPYEAWKETKNTLHLYAQIVGKIRLALFPRLNHWWHVPLYVSHCGLTTRVIPYNNGNFEIEFNLIDHSLNIISSSGVTKKFPLYDGLSVSEFYKNIFELLTDLGIDVGIWAVPYKVNSTIPFAKDNIHKSYNKDNIEKFRRVLIEVNNIFEEFRGRFNGKSTPVHLFWHSFDLALTRFSGNPAPPMEGAGMVDQEAYSHEVISFGFWAGDETTPAPAFYSYTFPEPAGLTQEPLQPSSAYWGSLRGGAIGLLMYDEARKTDDPRHTILEFLESAYQAGVKKAGWDSEKFKLRPLK